MVLDGNSNLQKGVNITGKEIYVVVSELKTDGYFKNTHFGILSKPLGKQTLPS